MTNKYTHYRSEHDDSLGQYRTRTCLRYREDDVGTIAVRGQRFEILRRKRLYRSHEVPTVSSRPEKVTCPACLEIMKCSPISEVEKLIEVVGMENLRLLIDNKTYDHEVVTPIFPCVNLIDRTLEVSCCGTGRHRIVQHSQHLSHEAMSLEYGRLAQELHAQHHADIECLRVEDYLRRKMEARNA